MEMHSRKRYRALALRLLGGSSRTFSYWFRSAICLELKLAGMGRKPQHTPAPQPFGHCVPACLQWEQLSAGSPAL